MGKTTILIEFIFEIHKRPTVILSFVTETKLERETDQTWNIVNDIMEKGQTKLMEAQINENRCRFLNVLFELAEKDYVFGICFASSIFMLEEIPKDVDPTNSIRRIVKVNLLYDFLKRFQKTSIKINDNTIVEIAVLPGFLGFWENFVGGRLFHDFDFLIEVLELNLLDGSSLTEKFDKLSAELLLTLCLQIMEQNPKKLSSKYSKVFEVYFSLC